MARSVASVAWPPPAPPRCPSARSRPRSRCPTRTGRSTRSRRSLRTPAPSSSRSSATTARTSSTSDRRSRHGRRSGRTAASPWSPSTATTPRRYPEDSAAAMSEGDRRLRLHVPVPRRRAAGRRQGVRRRLHAGPVPVRRRARLVYRGQFDASRPGGTTPVTGDDLGSAIDAVLDGRPVPADQRPSVGCSIKWKPGNAPA